MDDIEESRDNDSRIQAVVRKWLGKRSRNPSWESLITALKTKQVDEEEKEREREKRELEVIVLELQKKL